MKKFYNILLFFAIFIIASCSSVSTPVEPKDNIFSTQMMNSFEGYYSNIQFDSICKADKINKDLNKWRKLKLIDEDTKIDISQYIYIKSLGEKESIYRVQIINDSTMKITKRIRR